VLDDDAIARYARQIVIPGVGAAGQQKLLESTVLVAGDARGCEQATLYLRAAGVNVVRWPTGIDASVDIVIVANAAGLDDEARTAVQSCGKPLCWYVIEDDGFTSGLHPAAPLPGTPFQTAPAPVPESSTMHDAAACDAASVACAILLGLPHRSGPFRFSLSTEAK